VEHWRGSGQSAAEYAARRGYSSASLLRWAKVAEATSTASPREGPRFVRLEVTPAYSAGLIVEVGRARIVVERGFDAAQLRAVVEALSTERA